jgi:hypothetical protein
VVTLVADAADEAALNATAAALGIQARPSRAALPCLTTS